MGFLGILGIVILIVGIYFLINGILNVIVLSRIKGKPILKDGPMVSVCIPARNEEDNIGKCLDSLMNQTYTNMEILVLDDNSNDRTADIINECHQKDSRIRYLKGKPLEKGWKGKTFGMQQLIENSKGEFILFVDADTIHGPDSVANGISIAVQRNVDFVSGYPRELCPSYAGSVAISAMVFLCLALPMFLQPWLNTKTLASCIGQYMLVRKTALLEIGGMTSIKNGITDDVNLVRKMVGNGHRALLTSFKEHVSCNMYPDLKSAIHGIGRSITGIIPTWMFSFLIIAVFGLFLSSFSGIASLVWLIISGYSTPAMMILGGSLLIWIGWAIVARFEGFSFLVAFSQPLSFIMTALLYNFSVFSRIMKKSIKWKGREV